MNILFVIGSLELGGAQSFLLRLASYLKQQGHNVFIYNIHPEKFDPQILSFLTTDVTIINAFYKSLEIKLSRLPILAKLFRKIFKYERFDSFFLNRFIKKYNIQVINTHLYLADLYLSKLQLNPQIPLISSWHGCYNLLIDDYQKKNALDKLKSEAQKIFDRFNYIIFAAEKHKDAYEKLRLTLPYTKIYYGFSEPKNIKPADFDKNNAFVFGLVARGDSTKGWAEAIEAFKQVKQQTQQPVKLVLVGWSDFLAELKKQISDPDIVFAGQTDNPLGWIYHFDVGLLPTYFPAESLPNSIIEYLAMGKPVIATDWAEIPQMIDSPKGKAGILIPLANGKPDIEAMADAMLNLIENKNLHLQLAKNTKFAFEKFSMERCAEEYLKIFQQVLSNPVID